MILINLEVMPYYRRSSTLSVQCTYIESSHSYLFIIVVKITTTTIITTIITVMINDNRSGRYQTLKVDERTKR